MTRLDASNEPSMEDILASIRKIIAEDPPGSRPAPPAAPRATLAPQALSPLTHTPHMHTPHMHTTGSDNQDSVFSHTPVREPPFDRHPTDRNDPERSAFVAAPFTAPASPVQGSQDQVTQDRAALEPYLKATPAKAAPASFIPQSTPFFPKDSFPKDSFPKDGTPVATRIEPSFAALSQPTMSQPAASQLAVAQPGAAPVAAPVTALSVDAQLSDLLGDVMAAPLPTALPHLSDAGTAKAPAGFPAQLSKPVAPDASMPGDVVTNASADDSTSHASTSHASTSHASTSHASTSPASTSPASASPASALQSAFLPPVEQLSEPRAGFTVSRDGYVPARSSPNVERADVERDPFDFDLGPSPFKAKNSDPASAVVTEATVVIRPAATVPEPSIDAGIAALARLTEAQPKSAPDAVTPPTTLPQPFARAAVETPAVDIPVVDIPVVEMDAAAAPRPYFMAAPSVAATLAPKPVEAASEPVAVAPSVTVADAPAPQALAIISTARAAAVEPVHAPAPTVQEGSQATAPDAVVLEDAGVEPFIQAPSAIDAAQITMEDTVADLLRPMLRTWLADNMPRIVERALRREISEQLHSEHKTAAE